MARSRFNPWAAYVDLFGGLLIVSLGVLVVSQGAAEILGKRVVELEGARTKQEQQAAALFKRIKDAFDGSQQVRIDNKCSTARELCIDVNFEFPLDKDVLSSADLDLAGQVATELGHVLQTDADHVEILVEGHTDSTPARNAINERARFRHNWNLSAQRASSVMFELNGHGLKRFPMKALGRADTDPRCKSSDEQTVRPEECRQRNRRTTLKVTYRFERGPDQQ